MRYIKALPFLLVGIMMVVSSRETATKYGLMLVLGSLIYIWVQTKLSPKKEIQK